MDGSGRRSLFLGSDSRPSQADSGGRRNDSEWRSLFLSSESRSLQLDDSRSSQINNSKRTSLQRESDEVGSSPVESSSSDSGPSAPMGLNNRSTILTSKTGLSSFLFGTETQNDLPDSTTNLLERDSPFAPARCPHHASRMSAADPIAWPSSNDKRPNLYQTGLALTSGQAIPRAPFTFPVTLSSVGNRAMVFLKEAGGSGVVGRPGGLMLIGGGGIAGDSGSVNGMGVVRSGYSTREVLERLVKDQRNYEYQLASPTTPGKYVRLCKANEHIFHWSLYKVKIALQ